MLERKVWQHILIVPKVSIHYFCLVIRIGLIFLVILLINTSFEKAGDSESLYSYNSRLHSPSIEKMFTQIQGDFIQKNVIEIALNGIENVYIKKLKEYSKYAAIVDLSVSSNKKRFLLFDLEKDSLLYQTYVAHGKSSGDECANSFSNIAESHKSSLGFYKVAETYDGKHGLSVRLDGLELSNSNARDRAIVIHSADYVSEDFIENNYRLGRSLGCPALPKDNYEEIVSIIENGANLFIYYPDNEYLISSEILNNHFFN